MSDEKKKPGPKSNADKIKELNESNESLAVEKEVLAEEKAALEERLSEQGKAIAKMQETFTPAGRKESSTDETGELVSLFKQLIASNESITKKIIVDQDARSEEDRILESDEFETIEEKWEHLEKNGAFPLYHASINLSTQASPFGHSEHEIKHSTLQHDLTAAELMLFHHACNDSETINAELSNSIVHVYRPKNKFRSVSRDDLFDELKKKYAWKMGKGSDSSESPWKETFDKLFPNPDKLPLSIDNERPYSNKYTLVPRELIDITKKINDNTTVEHKYYKEHFPGGK